MCSQDKLFPELKKVKDKTLAILYFKKLYICTRTPPITHKKLPVIPREAIPFNKSSHYSISWQLLKKDIFIHYQFWSIWLQKDTEIDNFPLQDKDNA